MSHSGTFLVVGDDYTVFASNDHVVTAAAFIERLSRDESWTGNERIVIGQGIGRAALDRIRELLSARHISNVEATGALVPVHLTHKRDPENVMIASVMKRAAQVYQFELVVSEKKDRLSDHVTGQHIGAMQLMEAARQAVVATLECEYVRESGCPLGFVLERFDSRFDSYVFPVPTELVVTVTPRTPTSEKQISVTLTIQFSQVGQQICEMQLDVRLHDAGVLARVEAKRARGAMGALLQTVWPTREPMVAE